MSCWSGWLTQPGTMTRGIPELRWAVPLVRRQGCSLHTDVTKGDPHGSKGPGAPRAAYCSSFYPARGKTNYKSPWENSFPSLTQGFMQCSPLLVTHGWLSLGTTEAAFAAGKILPHKMKYLKSIYIPTPSIRNGSPGKSFGFQITCVQPSKTPFLTS